MKTYFVSLDLLGMANALPINAESAERAAEIAALLAASATRVEVYSVREVGAMIPGRVTVEVSRPPGGELQAHAIGARLPVQMTPTDTARTM